MLLVDITNMLLGRPGDWPGAPAPCRTAPARAGLGGGLAARLEANERTRRLYAKAGYTPDGSTRVEPEYEATEIRLVKALP